MEIAWEKKVPAVPIFSRGENRVWLTFPQLRKWATKNIGYPFPVLFWIIPTREEITMFIGNPINPEEIRKMDDYPDEVTDYEFFKKAYYAELLRLINENEKDYPLSTHLKEEIEKIIG